MLTFDEASHTYTHDGEVVPSVTQILDKGICSYAGVPRQILEAAAVRGNYIHKACELMLWDNLDLESVESAYLPYVQGFEKFLAESGVVVELPEQRVFHGALKYAGTADLIGRMKKNRKQRRCVIDYKTCFRLMPSVGPQLAAYEQAFNCDASDPVEDRYALHLRKDGTYLLEPYTSPQDFYVFKACLTLFNFTKRKAA